MVLASAHASGWQAGRQVAGHGTLLQDSHHDLQLHDVPTCWCPHQACPHIWVILLEAAHVTRVLKMLQHILVVASLLGLGQSQQMNAL